jgi:hypothetical protein
MLNFQKKNKNAGPYQKNGRLQKKRGGKISLGLMGVP